MRRAKISLLCVLLVCIGIKAIEAQESASPEPTDRQSRPNVLWITSEDNGPHLGCYGDEFASTSNLDALAEIGTIYRYCWSNAPVCAPARTTLISGMYPPSTGAEHMRSLVRLPKTCRLYPEYLREAGYFCTNNSKEDYNLTASRKIWDQSNRKAHWRNRREGQPFFSIFNFTVSHESQIRKRPHEAIHDPELVRLPAYHPDTPETRQDWAQYYDKVSEMDKQAGHILDQLREDGLFEDTIIFYYSDHGSGMPRSKRWPYNSGLHVPLIIYMPEKFLHLSSSDFQAGGESQRLVSFVDFAPTLLSLCGIKPPDHFQGHAFLGEHVTEAQPYIYGFRGRMDERYDMVRTVRDDRYVYIRNYMPHQIYGQYIDYMFQTPTTRVWHDLFHAGKLTPPQTHFWQNKASEELYDLHADSDEVENLASSTNHQTVLKQMRDAQEAWAVRIRDVGFLSEAQVHSRSTAAGVTPYEYAQSEAYDLVSIMNAAGKASSWLDEDTPELLRMLTDDDSALRYWAVMGCLIRGENVVNSRADKIVARFQDPDPAVRVIAAHAIALYTNQDHLLDQALEVLLEYANVEEHGLYLSIMALNGLDELDQRARSKEQAIKLLPAASDDVPGRMQSYTHRLILKTLKDLKPLMTR